MALVYTPDPSGQLFIEEESAKAEASYKANLDLLLGDDTLDSLKQEIVTFEETNEFTKYLLKKQRYNMILCARNDHRMRLSEIERKGYKLKYEGFGDALRQTLREGKMSIQDGYKRWDIVSVCGRLVDSTVLSTDVDFFQILRSDEPATTTSFGKWTHEYIFSTYVIQVTLKEAV